MPSIVTSTADASVTGSAGTKASGLGFRDWRLGINKDLGSEGWSFEFWVPPKVLDWVRLEL